MIVIRYVLQSCSTRSEMFTYFTTLSENDICLRIIKEHVGLHVLPIVLTTNSKYFKIENKSIFQKMSLGRA